MNQDDAEEYTQALGQIGGGLWRQILWAQQQGVPYALGLSLRDWVDKRLGGYVRMSVEERRQVVLELTEAEGLSNVAAAGVLGVDEKTVRNDRSDKSELTRAEPQVAEDSVSEFSEVDRTDLIQELAAQHQPEPVAD